MEVHYRERHWLAPWSEFFLVDKLNRPRYSKDGSSSRSKLGSIKITPSVTEKLKSKFHRKKFNWKQNILGFSEDSSADSDNVEVAASANKYIKLEDGERLQSGSSHAEETFSDDLPDLEDCFIVSPPLQKLNSQPIQETVYSIKNESESGSREAENIINVQVVENWNSDDEFSTAPDSPILPTPSPEKEKAIKFSAIAKQNLANILKKVKPKTKCSNSLSGLQTADKSGQEALDDSKDRHFLDFVDVPEIPEQCSSKSSHDIDWRIPPVVLPPNNFNNNGVVRRRRPKCKSTKRQYGDCSQNRVSSDIRNYIQPVKKSYSIEKERNIQYLMPMRCKLPEMTMHHLSADLENLHVSTVTACLEEEHPDFLKRGLEFVDDFLCKYEPSSSVINQVLHQGFLRSRDMSLMLKSYQILLRINQEYPEMIKMDWEMLQDIMNELCIGRGLFLQDPLILWLASHFLQLFITVLETDLYSKDLTKNIRQTMAYKLISYDCAYLNLKELVNWIVCSITCGEYPELIDQRYIQVEDQMSSLKRADSPKILPLLQELLALAITVSTSCKESAKSVASELLKSYSYLPSLPHKKLLIESMSSDLLRYRFVTLVLETYSEDCIPPCEFPMDLKSIIESFFPALPPRYGLTPPTTPQSEDEEDGPNDNRTGQYPTVMVDELVLLLYHAVQSHLHCTRRKKHRSLRSQCYYKLKDLQNISKDDKEGIKLLPEQLESLRERLLNFNPDLSRETELYLAKMACFSDL